MNEYNDNMFKHNKDLSSVFSSFDKKGKSYNGVLCSLVEVVTHHSKYKLSKNKIRKHKRYHKSYLDVYTTVHNQILNYVFATVKQDNKQDVQIKLIEIINIHTSKKSRYYNKVLKESNRLLNKYYSIRYKKSS